MFIRAFSAACSVIAIGCIVGGSVVFFTVGYHNKIAACEPPTVKAEFSTLFGNVTICKTPR